MMPTAHTLLTRHHRRHAQHRASLTAPAGSLFPHLLLSAIPLLIRWNCRAIHTSAKKNVLWPDGPEDAIVPAMLS
jgi:hypothetical protein